MSLESQDGDAMGCLESRHAGAQGFVTSLHLSDSHPETRSSQCAPRCLP